MMENKVYSTGITFQTSAALLSSIVGNEVTILLTQPDELELQSLVSADGKLCHR